MRTSAPYVALGDSFAAGIGSQTPGQHCRRAGGYPVLLSRAVGLDLDYRACRGATVEDVLSSQVEAVGTGTHLVTLTVGAYDTGLTDVALVCATSRTTAGAISSMEAARRMLASSLPGRLSSLLIEIRERSPKACLVVTGYPSPPVARGSRGARAARQSTVETFTDDLDDLLLEVARGQSAIPVDIRGVFGVSGERGGVGAMHGLTIPLEHSFLPRACGHEAFAVAIADAIAESGYPEPARSALRRGMAVPAVHTGPDLVGSGRLVSARSFLARSSPGSPFSLIGRRRT